MAVDSSLYLGYIIRKGLITKGNNMKKHIVLAVFFLWQAAFGLQAPYLYSADSVADTAIQLTWRNNSVDYQGIIVSQEDHGCRIVCSN